ncbi:hypothetical protein [Streptomyces sp. HUAS ZL42]|uniref:hypothetical protein n=1 Tax=Streptomyces sp. HUAS ZL42 TaxID=3231715 RepID=UPI00345E983C
MAWDEWEQLKSEAGDGHATQMRLNQLPAEGGGGGGDLVAYQDDLGAVGHDAYLLYDDISKGADIATAGAAKDGVGSTSQAAAGLKSHNFAMGGALEKTVEVWSSQLKSVLQACAHISNHLNYSQKRHAEDDAQISTVLRASDGSTVSVSQLDKYFK